jgi:hypothetical protein
MEVDCNKHFTVKQFLLESHDLARVCDIFYRVNSFTERFASVTSKTLIIYIKGAGDLKMNNFVHEVQCCQKAETQFKIFQSLFHRQITKGPAILKDI